MPGVVPGFPTGAALLNFLLGRTSYYYLGLARLFFSLPSTLRHSRGDTTVRQKEKRLSPLPSPSPPPRRPSLPPRFGWGTLVPSVCLGSGGRVHGVETTGEMNWQLLIKMVSSFALESSPCFRFSLWFAENRPRAGSTGFVLLYYYYYYGEVGGGEGAPDFGRTGVQ